MDASDCCTGGRVTSSSAIIKYVLPDNSGFPHVPYCQRVGAAEDSFRRDFRPGLHLGEALEELVHHALQFAARHAQVADHLVPNQIPDLIEPIEICGF